MSKAVNIRSKMQKNLEMARDRVTDLCKHPFKSGSR